jgi:phosphatidylserine/phosphatidylglycerophosphate/cardiolipin synthase-like enzyme
VSGLPELVPLAELLAELAGSRRAATELAADVLARGTRALATGHDDLYVAVRQQLAAAGVTEPDGSVALGRAAELIAVCEVLAAATTPAQPHSPDPRLVLSAPPGTVEIADGEKLDGLVLDVVRQAITTLHVGGAFWNDDGFALLEDVLVPAITDRGTRLTIYANSPARTTHRAPLERRLDDLGRRGPITVLWFTGPEHTMLHAKFVVGDRNRGYLGTANLTSWGLRGHVEAGVELTPGQSARLVRFLEQLLAAGLFEQRAFT